jgi:hypothetical protein
MTDTEIKEECLKEAGMDLGSYSYSELQTIFEAMRRYHNAKLKKLPITDAIGSVCDCGANGCLITVCSRCCRNYTGAA